MMQFCISVCFVTHGKCQTATGTAYVWIKIVVAETYFNALTQAIKK
jgi:hypothetical protein